MALKDDDALVRRTAVLLMGKLGESALSGLRKALGNDDALVRRNAALSLGSLGPGAVSLLDRALRDDDALVRQAAVVALLNVRPKSPEVLAVLRRGAQDASPAVMAAVTTALQDYLELTWEMRLPDDGWRFIRDPGSVGETNRWYATDLDDSGWSDIGIDLFWGSYGHEGYTGDGWYRRTIELPASPGADAVFLRFGAVDECARIWVNGTFVGEHNIGPSGWDKPFQVEVTGAVRWGQPNLIVVLVNNSAQAGGIWQPVYLQAATSPQ